MPKTKAVTTFVCQQCGNSQPKWMGRCPDCGAWNSLQEYTEKPASAALHARAAGVPLSTPQRLKDVESESIQRIPLAIEEFSRVLGGGLVQGSLVLVGGDPGVGKSTILTAVAAQVAEACGRVLYVSGEESVRQIKLRIDRLDLGAPEGAAARGENLFLVTETNLATILEHVERIRPMLLVVDSVQTVYLDELTSTAGSITQVRECAARLQLLAKASGTAVFLVGHVTKEGAIAGPKVLEHIVDTVLYLEGDRYHAYRLLRSVKNRFGPTSEVGVFEMRATGMVEVANPSEAFLAERLVNAPGSAIAVTVEGTRPILVEVQALATPTSFPNPRRTPNGIDFNRLLLITAVLGKRAGLRLAEQDVFVNVVGGLAVDEPAADLAVAVAVASSLRDRPVWADMAFIGELGLNGELRAVGQLGTRVREAAKLGFKRCIVPRTARPPADGYPDGIQILAVRALTEALQLALVPEAARAPAAAAG